MDTTPRRVGDGYQTPQDRDGAGGSPPADEDAPGSKPFADFGDLADAYPGKPGRERPSREAAFSAVAGPTGPGSLVQLAVGAHLLTLGTPDGSEVVPLPVTSRPIPERTSAEARPSGHPPLGRTAEIIEIRGMLSRGTSVRVGGPAGIGRSTLLRHLASGDAVGAPDGVVVLDGRRRGLADLLQQFHDACFSGEPHRPGRDTLAGLLVDVAALVVVDDLDISAAETDELLRIAPECVFLVAAKASPRNPDGSAAEAAARADSPFHEITLGGLSQDAAFALLARAADRELDDEELAWAAALWFEADGHPGRFVQAGALLARLGTATLRDAKRGGGSAYDLVAEQFGSSQPELPSPGEPRLFVPRLVPLLSPSAQQVLRLGAALEGLVPDPAHLPALTGATDADDAATELVAAGLAVAEGGRYRLAAGVIDEAAGLMRGPSSWTVAAMQHFTWWVSHPTVSAAQVADEADVILACLREVERLGKPSSVRVLARAAAPAFASALRFEAWRTCLELGGAACASSGASTEQAWFRHELAVLSLCEGDPDQAREEATAASRLRDASDKRGLAADRRVLLLAGERPRTVAGAVTDVAAVSRRRAVSASMAGKRGVMTLGAAAVLVVTLGVVIGLGSTDSSGGGGSPGTGEATVSRTAPVGGGSPAGAAAPERDANGRASGATSSTSAHSPTASDARSASASKSPTATGSGTTPPGTSSPPPPAPGDPGGAPQLPPPPPPVPNPQDSTPGPPQTSPEPPVSSPPPSSASPTGSPTTTGTATTTPPA
ncbi:hypothetical protein LO772_12025 [Yinghuangia sp. ASG 101]|uniref:hypothetical protein n=1 Tax=Yinghuangia sp. ASG 101 TaxID=2896848 RepID=UPI001E4CD392|nr:hypothetical protein [Yinghuangia sp. ASG 101]UGQ15718.1 hypothetical protein LO772_12025 [Yinghuangia sp. ASG 101]